MMKIGSESGREQAQRQGDPVRDLKAKIHDAQVPQSRRTMRELQKAPRNVGV